MVQRCIVRVIGQLDHFYVIKYVFVVRAYTLIAFYSSWYHSF